MILFDGVVEILALPQLIAFRNKSFLLEFFEGFGIHSVFVDRNHTRPAGMRRDEHFEKEALAV